MLKHIFIDKAEMQWAFDWTAEMLRHVGITRPDDERFAVTLRKDQHALHVNVGGGLLLGFRGVKHGDQRVRVVFEHGTTELPDDWVEYNFADRIGFDLRQYLVPVADVRPLPDDLRDPFLATVKKYVDSYGTLNRSSERNKHQEVIGQAIFDPTLRDSIFSNIRDQSFEEAIVTYNRDGTFKRTDIAERLEDARVSHAAVLEKFPRERWATIPFVKIAPGESAKYWDDCLANSSIT